MAAAPVYEESSKNSTESEFLGEDDVFEERSDFDFAERPGY